MKLALFVGLCAAAVANVTVVNHNDLKPHGYNGNKVTAVANPALGSKEFEVWRSSWAPGQSTPLHSHNTEEIFVFMKGEGKVIIDGNTTFFKAPCTIICPANKPHQFFNTGTEDTDAVVVMGANSQIVNAASEEMLLPWR